MSNYNELVSILKELLTNRFYPKPEYIRGLLGDGRGNVLVPDRVDYNYVRFSRASAEVFEVFNKEVSQPVDGWPVLIGSYPWAPNLVQVVATDWSAYAQTGWGDESASIQAHAPTHEWPNFVPGSDAINTYLRAITPMRTQAAASGSASVMVTSYEYDGATGTNYGWPGTPPLSLVAATPPSGTMRYMGVYLNPATNTLGVVTGTPTIYTDALEPDRPAWPRGVFPSAYVRLYWGQVQINERDVRDARRLWNNTLIFTGTVGLPTPIVTGSFLGSGAGVPAWTYVSQLAASDGSPSPAWAVDNAGNLSNPGGGIIAPAGVPYAIGTNLLSDSLTHEASWLAGTTFNDLADDNYGPALWTILNDANAPDVAGVAGGSTDPFTRYLAITLDATTRVGAVQFIPAEKTTAYRGKVVSLSADLWATGITAVRMAVAVWTSTGDVLTSDLVGTWGSNPTLATNWAFIGTPADITISTTPGARKIVQNLLIPTNAVNIAVFIWTPNQEASTDVLNIACVKLEPGPVATEFIGRGQAGELREIGYTLQLVDATSNAADLGLGTKTGAATLTMPLKLDYPMRITPVLIHNITGYTAGAPGTTTVAAVNYVTGAFFVITGSLTVTLFSGNKSLWTVRLTAGTSWDGTNGDLAAFRVGPGVVMLLSARL